MSSQKWCKLRGNLLFYFKSNDQFSEPAGVIVLEKYRVTIPEEQSEAFEGFPFYIGKEIVQIYAPLAYIHFNSQSLRMDWTSDLVQIPNKNDMIGCKHWGWLDTI